MAICTFWGHERIIDAGLGARLRGVLDEIVRDNSCVDFWFTETGGDFLFDDGFLNLCFTAAWEAKQHNRAKRITITLVVPDGDGAGLDRRMGDYAAFAPPCLVDRVLVSPCARPAGSQAQRERSRAGLARWMQRRSDCLVTYIYADLFDACGGSLAESARRGQRVFSLTSADTEGQIVRDADTLVAQERYIFKKLRSGKSLREIGAALNTGIAETRRRAMDAGETLRRQAAARMRSLRESEAEGPERVCSVLALGAPTREAVSALSRHLAFLAPRYSFGRVDVLSECCGSAYIGEMKRMGLQRGGRYVAITHLPRRAELAPEEWRAVAARYCPPCWTAENIDTHTLEPRVQLRTAIDALIDRSDFCICDLGASAWSEEIRHRVERSGRAKLLNIGDTRLPPVERAS